MLDDLLPLIPYDNLFVDVFGGGGSVLLNRKRSPVEVYNDLDGNLVNLFRVLQTDPLELERRLRSTLYSKEEFVKAIHIIDGRDEPADDIERAWAMFVNMNQSVVGRVIRTQGNWSRAAISVSGESAVVAGWKSLVNRLGGIYDRLSGVQVEQREANEALRYWDGSETVFYVDTPYIHDTRVESEYYAHEMSDEAHEEMVSTLLECRGYVVLSGYDHPIYNKFDDAGWERVEFRRVTTMTASQRGKGDDWDRDIKPRGERVEVVWLNQKAHSQKADPTLWDTL